MWLCSVGKYCLDVEDLFHHLKLYIVQGLGWQLWSVSSVVDFSVWDSGIERGFNPNNSSEKSYIIYIDLFDVRSGQGESV